MRRQAQESLTERAATGEEAVGLDRKPESIDPL
jgi:hypothetical protein